MSGAERMTGPPGASRFRLGSAPDSWGVWFPDDPAQVPWQRFLDELAAAGYEWLELGPHGYLPTDPHQLGDEVGRRGLKVSAGDVAGAIHRVDAWPSVMEETRRVAELTAAVGGRYLVLMPDMYRDVFSGEFLEPTLLDDDGWKTLVGSVNELGRIVSGEYGISLVFHPHADSHVETQEEIERLLADTDPEHVSLCLDTGHIVYRGGDSLALIRDYPERIGYVHIKQMDPAILGAVEEENLAFGEAVRRGVCCEPPAGVPPIERLADALTRLDVQLWVIVEQDLYPCAPEVPLPIATRTREFLIRCGLGSPPNTGTAEGDPRP
jgi:inosose dehydratase